MADLQSADARPLLTRRAALEFEAKPDEKASQLGLSFSSEARGGIVYRIEINGRIGVDPDDLRVLRPAMEARHSRRGKGRPGARGEFTAVAPCSLTDDSEKH